MSRKELLDRLQSQEPVSSEACFVLLWTYLTLGRVAVGENRARSQSLHHFQIGERLPGGRSLRDRVGKAVDALGNAPTEEFDFEALRLLAVLDQALRDEPLGEDWFNGLDGMEYQVRPRNLFLVGPDQVTTEKDQSGTKALYTRLHVAVPRAVEGITLDTRRFEDWAEATLRHRLERDRTRLRVMLWPLETVLQYSALQNTSQDSSPGETPSPFVTLNEIRNEDALCGEVKQALAAARTQRVSLLIFPELAIPPRVREEIRETLRSHGADGHPMLTLLGCCHCPAPNGGDLNEALLFGPAGEELCRHRKLTSFTTHLGGDRSRVLGEQLQVGTTVTVLEGAFGNLTPLICLDFIHMPLRQVLTRSHANVFAVPSLSPTTGAHQDAARAFQTSSRASSFVSNRALDGLKQEATSFFRVPWRNGYRAHLPASDPSPYLLFSLEDWLQVDKTST